MREDLHRRRFQEFQEFGELEIYIYIVRQFRERIYNYVTVAGEVEIYIDVIVRQFRERIYNYVTVAVGLNSGSVP